MSDFESRVAAAREKMIVSNVDLSHIYAEGFDAATALYRDEIARLEAQLFESSRHATTAIDEAAALQAKLDAISALHVGGFLQQANKPRREDLCRACGLIMPCTQRRILDETPQPALTETDDKR